MEINDLPVKEGQLLPKSIQYLPEKESLDKDEYSISLYHDSLTKEGVTSGIKKIKLAFPQLPAGFYEILIDMIKEDKFTDMRFNDAVNYVIRTCTYPQPAIAQFLSFDKREKVNTYNEMCKKVEESGRTVWNDYVMIDLSNGKKGWINKMAYDGPFISKMNNEKN